MICDIRELGLIDYPSALESQRDLHKKVCRGALEGAIILCEHLPCITLGRSASHSDILSAERERAGNDKISLYASDRGGAITYHAPGQLIAYPIFDLSLLGRDIHRYLRNLEKAVISALRGLNIEAYRKNGSTGVWASDKKIASIGVAVSRWVTYHGIALNVSAVMDRLEHISPCGIEPAGYTSIEEVLGRIPQSGKTAALLLGGFREAFGVEYIEDIRISRVA